MILKDNSGASFELNVAGYQFPGLQHAEYDSNWLLIRLEVESPLGSWKSTDLSLLTYEVEALANWLEEIELGEPSKGGIEFIEPNLSLRIWEEEPDIRKLRVYFELECRPSWAASRAAPEADLWIELELSDLDLQAAADDLRRQLRRYLRRANV